MFKRDLSVPDDAAPTPAVSTPTPAVSTPSSSILNTPLPEMTPGTTMIRGNMYDGENDDVDVENTAGEEGAEEPEEDVIRRFTMQNPFTPANALSVGNRVMAWAETPAPVSAAAFTPAVATPATVSSDMTPSTAIPTKPGDIQSQIAAWKTRLGASSPIVHNVVATANLGVSLDLKKIALTARNAEYNPRRFAAVVMRIREPKSTALVFKSGKLVVTGTKSEEEAKHAARKFGRVIMKVGYSEAKFREFRVENLVSTFTVPFPIHLEQLYKDLPANMHSQYEPEVFPGLIFRAPTGTLLIFVSGKCVMIGMKTQEDIDKAFLFILPRLDKHRKK